VPHAAGTSATGDISSCVLLLLLLLLQASDAAEVMDAWLQTPFTAGYPEVKVKPSCLLWMWQLLESA
jgi:hypothetical protein